MKKILFILLLLSIAIFFKLNNLDNSTKLVITNKKEEMRAVFISYIELNTYIHNKTKDESIENINNIIKKLKSKKFNTIILQVRSFDDAIYESSNFPVSENIILKDGSYYDVVDYFEKKTRENKLDLYLWINPFRITRKNEEINPKSYAYKYKETDTVKKIDDIYYYNPSSSYTISHIIDGVLELTKKYNFKGILFDDYFYPSNDIDTNYYEDYIKNNEYITKSEYNLKIINNLISKVYKEIKKINKNILFGISPDGNIQNNYQKNYADVKTWASSKGYVDFLMPQLYYGFYNTTKPYFETMNDWNDMVTNKSIKLYYALAFYKIGKIDNYAKEGQNEWIENSDIIKRQIILARNTNKYNGFSLFRYDNLFNKNYYTENTLKEIENVEKIIN